ncbi:dTDP-4-dehydrorhamnose reductase [Candidatus Saccharibacteria bacterium]|nr:dTDP-4-dehydrorhamnose reductase [Candidatus Saccharibacteria bacterium]
MKVLVTGTSGQLGHDVMLELTKRGIDCLGADRQGGQNADFKTTTLDITDQENIEKTFAEYHPDAVIHCAAWTNVDAAEAPENLEAVRKVNVEGTANLAKACAKINAKMLYISTDYVFNGQGEKPWQPDDKNYAPLNVYGQSKLDGEKAVTDNLKDYFIVRIAWVFGKNGKNFVKTMLEVGKNHEEVRVVDDQIGTPTYTPDLSRLLVDMILTDKYGFYHATNEGGYISWADFTKEIFAQAGINSKVIPVTTAEYGESIAKRPFNSRLDKSKLTASGFEPLPTWQDALSRYLRELQEA